MRIGLKQATAIITLFLCSPATAFDLGPLNGLLKTGQDGVWELRDEGASLVLDNDENSGAIKYYFPSPREGDVGRRKARVDIDFRNETASTRAGLLFGFDESDKSYFMFTLAPSGQISLVERKPTGPKILFQGKAKGVTDGVNTLTLEERGTSVALTVNDGSSLVSDSARMTRGSLGIVAWGKGEFAFHDFELTFRSK